MTTVQPTLDGTIPEPDTGLTYSEWVDHIRPAFVIEAKSGRRFTTYAVTKKHKLPEPANPRADWGNATQLFVRQGLIKHVDYTRSRRPTGEQSAVHVWQGTTAAQAGRVA
jgi:hypothetical protein